MTSRTATFILVALTLCSASGLLNAQATAPAEPSPPSAAPPAEPPATVAAPAPAPTPAAPAAVTLSFIDLQAFDDDLNDQLAKAGDNTVEVEFYSPVSPNQIPPRVERRLAAVRKEGGRVGIVQPQSNSSTRSIGAAIGLFSGLWNFMKTFEAASTERAMVRSVKDRDADIVLGRDEQGAMFIRKIVFKKRPPAEASAPKQG